MSKNNFYDYFSKKERKKQYCVNLYERQVRMIDKLVAKEVYHNRSECMRIAVEFFLSNEYIKALRNKENKIIETIRKHKRE